MQKGHQSKSPVLDLVQAQTEFEDNDNFVSMQASGHLSDNFPSETEEGEYSGDEPNRFLSRSQSTCRSLSQREVSSSDEETSERSQDSESEMSASTTDDSDSSGSKFIEHSTGSHNVTKGMHQGVTSSSKVKDKKSSSSVRTSGNK